jgi:Tol biopolymer transport system component
MTRLVADDRFREQIRVVDVASGDVLPLGPGADPDWSPDGSKIAYGRFVPASGRGSKDAYALETVRPDATGVTTVLSVNAYAKGWQSVSWPRWSPDGAYLAYKFTKDSNYVYRVASDGSGSTNLTPDATTGGRGYGFVLTDWR